MNNLKAVEAIAVKYSNDIDLIAKELKKVQSTKCRLKKQKGLKTYQDAMTSILQEEQLLKEARNLLVPKATTVTNYTNEDIKTLDYDQTIKAIRSIQSKKTLSKWLTTVEGDNEDYKNAVAIEQMLLEHKSTIQPVDNAYIRKTDLITIIDTIKSSGNLTQDAILTLLQDLI